MIRRIGVIPAFVVALCLGGVVGAFVRIEGETGHAGQDISMAAQKFTQLLNDEQKSKAVLPFETSERFVWHFIPKPERKGIQIKEMTGPQREAAQALLQACLSEVGYGKAEKIMSLEKVLKQLESKKQNGAIRDPERYYFTLFGNPAGKEQWGLSIEGHHLSLNFVLKENTVLSCTPAVFAANPAQMMETVEGVEKGTRILREEEVAAYELVKSFTKEQQQKAIIATEAPAEVRAAGEAQPPQTPLEGLLASAMTSAQHDKLFQLISTYTNNMPDELAKQRFEEVNRSDPKELSFAWAGSQEPGHGHYYRIQGPTFVIEFVNTQPDSAGNPANHIHAMWRDIRGDFGVPVAKK